MKTIQPVLTCGWTGYVKPTLRILEKDYKILSPIIAPLPRHLDYWYILKTIRSPKADWRREWKHWAEELPDAFKARTSVCEKRLDQVKESFDMIYLSGTLYGLGKWGPRKKVVLMNDSTRRLSASCADDTQRHFPNRQLEAEWYRLEEAVFRSAHATIVGCERVIGSMVQDYSIDQNKIHNCGFLAGLGHSTSSSEKNFDGKTILYVGKGDFEKKGGYFLINAFEKLRKTHPYARLVIAGQQLKFNIPGVESLGFIKDRNDLRKLYENAHVFALPSFVDRNPLTLVEAMSAATPVIATTYGAMPEIIGNAGYSVPPGDVDALCSVLAKVLEDPQHAKELGVRGRQRFEQIYSDDIVGSKILDVFSSVSSL